MILRKRFAVLSVVLILGLLLSSCSFTTQPAVPTIDAIALQATVDAAVAQAVLATALNQTSTAAVLPTSTFTATLEPIATETATATATPQPTATIQYIVVTNTFIPPTNTYIPPTQKPSATATPAWYSCVVFNISPSTGTKMKANADFDAVWKVRNNGTKAWEPGYVDLKYLSGTKMQTVADVFDVNSSVAQGGEITLTVDMRAPSSAGKYAASFVLVMEGTTMCTLPVNIEVTP